MERYVRKMTGIAFKGSRQTLRRCSTSQSRRTLRIAEKAQSLSSGVAEQDRVGFECCPYYLLL